MANGLVCAYADSPMVIPGSTFDRVCCECSRRLMVSPAGRRELARVPTLKTVCWYCAKIPPVMALDHAEFVAQEAMLREAATAVPNMRRYRN